MKAVIDVGEADELKEAQAQAPHTDAHAVSVADMQSDAQPQPQPEASHAASPITPADLRKLKRAELLEIMLAQSEEIDRLRAELDEKNRQLEQRTIMLQNAGSIAQASLALTRVFEEAQKAADLYVENVKRQADAGVAVDTDAVETEASPSISDAPSEPMAATQAVTSAQLAADVQAEATQAARRADTAANNGSPAENVASQAETDAPSKHAVGEADDSAEAHAAHDAVAHGAHAADAAREVREARYARATRQARETRQAQEAAREAQEAYEASETHDARTAHDDADAHPASFSSQPLAEQDNPQQRKPGDGLKAIEDLIQDLKVSGARHRG